MSVESNQPLQNSKISKMSDADVGVLSVEQLNIQIKQMLEGQIGTFWLKGEISNFKAHTSGHFYFSLKDAKSQISAVMFRGFNSKIKFKIFDGLEVLVKGRISVYEPRGNYQILCEYMEPVGAGALQKAFEELKLKLKSEGLFDSQKKRPIPSHPNRIVIISSPTGAAIQDFIQIVRRRAPFLDVILIPTLVQGEGAAEKIRSALQDAWKIKNVDVIVLARGGGSIEDLWAFNDESLARMIARSPIPTVSAIGHEIDFTIADFVSDLRAPTPSAAAELVCKSSKELEQKLNHFSRFLKTLMDQKIKNWRLMSQKLENKLIDPKKRIHDLILRSDELLGRLALASQNYLISKRQQVALNRQKIPHPEMLIKLGSSKVQHLFDKLAKSVAIGIEKRKWTLQSQMSLLDSFSPLKVLDRGYSIVQQDDHILKSSEEFKDHVPMIIRFAKGQIKIKPEKIK